MLLVQQELEVERSRVRVLEAQAQATGAGEQPPNNTNVRERVRPTSSSCSTPSQPGRPGQLASMQTSGSAAEKLQRKRLAGAARLQCADRPTSALRDGGSRPGTASSLQSSRGRHNTNLSMYETGIHPIRAAAKLKAKLPGPRTLRQVGQAIIREHQGQTARTNNARMPEQLAKCGFKRDHMPSQGSDTNLCRLLARYTALAEELAATQLEDQTASYQPEAAAGDWPRFVKSPGSQAAELHAATSQPFRDARPRASMPALPSEHQLRSEFSQQPATEQPFGLSTVMAMGSNRGHPRSTMASSTGSFGLSGILNQAERIQSNKAWNSDGAHSNQAAPHFDQGTNIFILGTTANSLAAGKPSRQGGLQRATLSTSWKSNRNLIDSVTIV
jgi:hypothetical protein